MLPTDINQSIQGQAQNVLVTGQRFKRFDQIRQRHFWSTYRFIPDANGFIKSGDFDIFQTPAGQVGQGFTRQLTLLETNWPSANRVPDNQNFEITEIGCGCTFTPNFPPDQGGEAPAKWSWYNAEAAQALILDNTAIGITYLTNTVYLGLCNDFAQAAGPQLGFHSSSVPQFYPTPGFGDDLNGDNLRTYYTNGFAAPGLRRRFKVPILLQHGETFRFTLKVDTGRGPFIWPFQAFLEPDQIQYMAFDVRVDFWATESFVENS